MPPDEFIFTSETLVNKKIKMSSIMHYKIVFFLR